MNKIAYLLLRLAIGTSMFGHGLVRLTKLTVFSSGMVKSFEKSMLPQALVVSFSYALPFVEFGIGLLLLIGLFTKQALVAGGLLMVILIFGTAMIEQWDNIATQLIHAAFFAVLLQFIPYNSYAVDKLVRK